MIKSGHITHPSLYTKGGEGGMWGMWHIGTITPTTTIYDLSS